VTPSDLFAKLPDQDRDRLRPDTAPAWVAPMLATLTDRRFSNHGWLFERKLDGERCLAFRNGSDVRLFSRARQRLDGTYPEIVDAIGRQKETDFVVDGEIVAFEGDRTSFELLQQRLGIADPEKARRSPVQVFFYLFDIPHLAGQDTTAIGLRSRKELLHEAISFSDPLRYTSHRSSGGEAYLKEACAKRWEGLIAKRGDSPYVGRRSPDWLKFKCSWNQELVVGGFTDPTGSRLGLGALLLGYYEGGELKFAGKVGTGFSESVLRDLRRRLDGLEVAESPFQGTRITERKVHWVRPELVCEVAFSEWTRDGKLRHPRFEGLRFDKSPTEVVRERPQAARG